ncbi:hypothetical protein [Vibrio mediterranei]|uniref:hypothetical protein n=1 Tax=Vibrio mediterranei TaxID=689 RepID=UPI00228392BE|nr:hypothetical protein [Vibrio mediterranei]MCY9854676.1 hypothetical protein [Vibrio mediterranei]
MNMQLEQAKPSWVSKLVATIFLFLGGLSFTEAKQEDTINSDDKNKLFVSVGFAWSDTWSNSLQHNIGAMAGKMPSKDGWAPLLSYQHLKYSEIRGEKPSLQTYMLGASYGFTDNVAFYFSGGVGDYRYKDEDNKALALGTGVLASFDFGLTLSGGFETSLVDSHNGQLTHLITRIGWSF